MSEDDPRPALPLDPSVGRIKVLHRPDNGVAGDARKIRQQRQGERERGEYGVSWQIVARHRQPTQADGEDRDEDDPEQKRRHRRQDRRNDKKGLIDNAVPPHAGRKAYDHAGNEGQADADNRDAQRGAEAAPHLRNNLAAADHRPAQSAGQRRGDPSPVLHDDRLIQPRCLSRLRHRLQGDALAVMCLRDAKRNIAGRRLDRYEGQGGDRYGHPRRRQQMADDSIYDAARGHRTQSAHLTRSIQKLTSSASTGTLS